MNKEVWKSWPINSKYQISSLGRVKGQNGRIMKTKLHAGYEWVNLAVRPGKPQTFSIHRLVAQTFLSDFNENLTVDHINGIPTDNRLENLQMVTNEENIRLRDIRRKNIIKTLNKIICTVGYEKTEKILNKIIGEVM